MILFRKVPEEATSMLMKVMDLNKIQADACIGYLVIPLKDIPMVHFH